MKDILDLHTHSIMSGHAYNTLYEMLHSASEKGVKLLGSTEHAPGIPGACHEYYFLNFRVIPREIYGVKLLMGCELNIIDYKGTIDLKDRFLKKIDFAIASIHDPCYKSGTAEQNTAAYLGAMKNPYVNIIGHPDDRRFPIDYKKLVLGAKEHHVLLEVNSSSLHPQSSRMGARENYLEMLEYCIPTVSSFKQPKSEMVDSIYDLLLGLMNKTRNNQHVTFQCNLASRESCKCL